MRSIVYWSRRDGLANRLRALAGYAALGRVLEAPFHFRWTPSPCCDCRFQDLFETADWPKISAWGHWARRLSGATVCRQNSWFPEIWRRHAAVRVDYHEFGAEAVRQLRRLRPVAAIRAAVEAFEREHDLRTAAAVHIRMTDNVEAAAEWRKTNPTFNPRHFSTLAGFRLFIDDHLRSTPNGRIFLATDNPVVEQQLRDAYGDRILVFQKRYLDPAGSQHPTDASRRASSISEALVEMLLLSRCPRMVGTYFSSFSVISALLGTPRYMVVRGMRYGPNRQLDVLQRSHLRAA